MLDDVTDQPQQPDYSSISRKQLVRALLKAIPHLGPLIDDMTYGVLEKEAGRRDKDKLDQAFNSIRMQQSAAATDLGDILLKLDQARLENLEVRDALHKVSAFLMGEADETDDQLVLAAMQRTIPHDLVVDSGQQRDGERGQDILRIAMREQLTLEMLQAVVRNYSTAKDWVSTDQAKLPIISKLVEWAKSADGEGLGSLVAYIKRQHPNFKLNPQ